MMQKSIVFVDSGIGGIPYLSWTIQNLPRQKYIYIADRENFPYGNKNPDILLKVISKLVQKIIQYYDPGIIVIACNTATIVTLSYLRSQFTVPFIGVVPAIKPAAQLSTFRRIGIMATSQTITNAYVDNLISMYARDCTIVRYAATKVVDFIENSYYTADKTEIDKYLKEIADFFLGSQVDTLVLGCTHFLHIKTGLKKLVADKIFIVDSVEGVGKQTIRMVQRHMLMNQPASEIDVRQKTTAKSRPTFYLTLNGGPNLRTQVFPFLQNYQKLSEKLQFNLHPAFSENLRLRKTQYN